MSNQTNHKPPVANVKITSSNNLIIHTPFKKHRLILRIQHITSYKSIFIYFLFYYQATSNRKYVLTLSYVPAGDRLRVVYMLAPYGLVLAIPLTAGTHTQK